MGTFLKNKIVLLGLGGAALLLAVYFVFFSGGSATETVSLPSAPSSTLLTVTPADASGGTVLGRNLIVLLDQLRAIRLDTTFFGRADYASLADWSSQIPPQEVGRRNPFLKLEGSVLPTVPSSAKKKGSSAKVSPPADSGFLESF